MSSKSHSEPDIAKTLDLDQTSGRGRRLRRWLIVALVVGGIVAVVMMRKSTDTSGTAQIGRASCRERVFGLV